MRKFQHGLAMVLALVAASSTELTGQVSRARLITEQVDNTKLQRLAGNTRPQANAQNDRGRVSDELQLDHMLLQLRRSPEQEQALEEYLEQLQDRTSPNYHRWLTADVFGQRYGAAPDDVETITNWLKSQGFTLNLVYASRMAIDFSGTAGQVRQAFHTEIHNLNVNGEEHIANMSDPRIPSALVPAVAGILSLHDFRPHAMRKARANYTFTSDGQTQQGLVPADLATIYNLNPLYSKGITGTGQTIAVIEDTDLYSATDWTTFRTTFGLNAYTGGSLTTIHPSATERSINCSDPGIPRGGDDGEAILDAEWASAAAPNAAIEVAACASTRTTFGGLIALQNLLNGAKPPAVMSVSYGECEAENGAASNGAFNSAYAQAATEGVSVFVAAGDEGAASCDAGASSATHGIGVSAWASTPNNVAMGGTDFSDTYHGTTATYWSAANGSTYGSALSYIPEIPWNDSCASGLWASYNDFTQTWGATGFCASRTAQENQFLEVVAGSGGPSGCATGEPSTPGVVGGTCAGWAKPSWQSGSGDGVRDIPDVSLFSGDGAWGHFYVFCFSDRRNGGAPCTGAPSTWAGAGGTSFAAPIMAGIQALVNQSTGSAQGNPNSVYYSLAASDSCNSSTGQTSGCVFHFVTEGDNDVNCSGTENCFGAPTRTTTGSGRHGGFGGGGNGMTAGGILSTSSSSDSPAYSAHSGWSFASGLGSVNAYNLVTNWPK